MYRIIFFLSILTLFSISSFSQDLNGKIEFKIEYELIKELETQRSSLATKMIIYMKDGFSRKEEITRIGSQVLINDNENDKSYLLMQIADKKLAIQVQDTSNTSSFNERITYIDQSKNIAGYSCKKAILNTYDSHKEEANTIELFYTDQIIGVYDLKFQNIRGTPLKYTVKSNGMTITYTAITVSTNIQNNYMFEIPKDFNILSMSEFKRLMSN
jgi:hypothetical protein